MKKRKNKAALSAKCIDVSSNQKEIDWRSVKAEGVNDAILRVIRKDMKPDPYFERNWKGCQDNGIKIRGVYNYSYATTVEKAEADAQKVLSILAGRKCTVWMDVEDSCQRGLGSLLKDIINAYAGVIAQAGYPFGVYTGMAFYHSCLRPYAQEITCDIYWIARYYKSDTKLDFSFQPDENYNPKKRIDREIYAWQYTSRGQVRGIDGNVDLSILYGNEI